MVKIVSDSTANLPAGELQALGVETAPSYIFFGDEEFKEGISLGYNDFIEKLKHSATLPQTAPATSAEFVNIYNKILQQTNEIISIHVSSKLSNIHRNASIAADMVCRQNPNAKITVIDSQNVDFGLGLIVREAAKAAHAGKSGEEIVALVKGTIGKIGGFVYIDTLEYLKRGGRVGRLAAFFGTLLNMKPILKLENGELSLADKVKGRENALDVMVSLLKQAIPPGANPIIGVVDAVAREEGDKYLNILRSQIPCREAMRASLCQSTTIHGGPGAIGVFYALP